MLFMILVEILAGSFCDIGVSILLMSVEGLSVTIFFPNVNRICEREGS